MPSSTRVINQELGNAAVTGDKRKVTALLKQGVDVNCVDEDEDTPLHFAAYGGHVGVVELLLKAGAQVDSRDLHDNTPLHEAAKGGHVGVVELLLKAGAQVDSRDEIGNTPLHKAASGGHVDVAELLLKSGAQVDSSRNWFHKTPEDMAASTDVPYGRRPDEKHCMLEGRDKILKLFAAVKVAR
ncbi:hypothetical protein Bbelb_232410 [Branchiostoma belcheri]|nr:hypothetical protein Bbelb_232410 [Branchiostoma belcheri]